MKTIIDNRIYDTETATLIASNSNGYPVNDFRYSEECLYQKKNGEYFLYGHGGALSRYAKQRGNDLIGGYRILKVTLEQAKRWASRHMSVDTYIKQFGTLTE